mmetsp:Transcript_18439/g.31542  ORF Transcript_18439/g.31542 Transcript_18439/m.31542 type:complete len:151 (-) Transcript_18439:138-590(-)|eukprot:CAMPEP_0168613708 /NCGR_PEP_ID=MMETSP0449_2-20121227/3593_1 /TAXON_ID=1082188 /ORGANISM="Strombidium rassoulzadegani, Strain ras09" /LENGTH=150 /DNA_ID=CAMNT_0008654355 /DNA_START=15 /DNA_END=467 /DNA_ORIENTATION=+
MPKYSYYDYIYNYNSKFLNKYQSDTHWYSGRGSHFMELLRVKSVRLKSNRNWMWFDIRFGTKFLYMIYMPQLFFVTISYLLSPAWRRLDERYHLRFAEGETDDIDDVEPFVTHDQRKKPMTRRKYADVVKIVYGGVEEYDYVTDQPMRYR